MARKRRKKRKKIFLPKVQRLFCIISILFILGCCVYYGNRLIKYYKIYNPKNESGELIANLPSTIISNAVVKETGEGIYNINGNYIYKGENVDNYIIVSNMLFRVLRINSDKTIDIVLDEYINRIKWNDTITDYEKTSLAKYLEEKVLPIFDEDILNPTTICTDPVYELSEINCEKTNTDSYIRILGLNDYINSLDNNKSYLNKNGEYLWLYNHGKNNAWNTTANSVSNSTPTNQYGIKPVITLKNSTTVYAGTGTKLDPYRIKKSDDIHVGTYLDINNDIYTVYEEGKDYYKIQSNKLLSKQMKFDDSSSDYTKSSLKKYLEDTYVERLSYKNLLKEVDFSKYKSKIGLLTLDDLKFNSSLKGYFLSDSKDSLAYLYNGSVVGSEVKTKRNIRIALGISKDLTILSGNGSKYAPFIVEVKDA